MNTSTPQHTPTNRRLFVALVAAAVYAVMGFIAVVYNSSITATLRGGARSTIAEIWTRRRAVPVLPLSSEASAVILVALRDGPAGEAALREWSNLVFTRNGVIPPVWVLCSPNGAIESAMQETPKLLPFPVKASSSSWTEAFERFLSRNPHASVVGLFGEGSLPQLDLSSSIKSVEPALANCTLPTAIVTRSRRRGWKGQGEAVQEEWLSDKFVAQVWCNREMLAQTRLQAELGLQGLRQLVQDATLLAVLPILLQVDPEHASPEESWNTVVVDGTQVLPSFVDGVASLSEHQHIPAIIAGGDGNDKNINDQLPPDFYIGTLDRALVHGGAPKISSAEGGTDGRVVGSIVDAPWPPPYVLETVANSDGLVIVTNVNCGYLDLATNFLMSVQSVSDAKVLFIAMDEVSFDYMDALTPGCTAMFPTTTTDQHLSEKAGIFGDHTFEETVIVRPSILKSILAQGYTVLWTDSDMYWFADPVPLLPDIKDPSAAEVMLQRDGLENNMCTCFMFMKPTAMAGELIRLWAREIDNTRAHQNQVAFQAPLTYLLKIGLKLDIISPEAMPAGKDFFYNDHRRSYSIPPNATIVHNNWIIGHDMKKRRFMRHSFWKVGTRTFPQCGKTASRGGASSTERTVGKVIILLLKYVFGKSFWRSLVLAFAVFIVSCVFGGWLTWRYNIISYNHRTVVSTEHRELAVL